MDDGKNKTFDLNLFRLKKFGDKYLITTNHNTFAVVSENEYKQLISNKLDKKLFQKMEDLGFILTEDNKPKIVSKIRERHNFLNQGTSLHIVVVTLRCNLTCTYCQASKRGESQNKFDMTQEIAKKTVDFIFQSPSKAITIEFQGGEPLLNFPIIKYIVDYANDLNVIYKKHLRFSVVSNLTKIPMENLDFLLENKVTICTSLDGPEKLHDKNRKFANGKGSHQFIVKSLARIKERRTKYEHYLSNVNALLTVSRDSLNNHKEIIDEYIDFGFKTIWLRFMSKLGCASSVWPKVGYNAEEFLEFYRGCLEYIVENDLPISERLTTLILQKILSDEDPNYLDLRSPCGAAIGQLAYNYDGSIFTCDEGRMVSDLFNIGDVEKSYQEVVASDETCNLVAASINDTFICDNCVYKAYCGLCPVCAYSETGSIVSKPLQEMRCKIFMGIFDFIFEKLMNDKKYEKKFKEWVEDSIEPIKTNELL